MRELKRVLVVVEDDVMRKSLELKLRKHYDIHCEKYGKMGIAYVKCQKVDLILLDMKLHFLDGVEALEMFRQVSESELTPIVILAEKGSPEIEQRCFALGVKEFLTKPVDTEDLIRTLDGILYNKKGITSPGKKMVREVAEMSRNFMPIAESVLLVGEDRAFLEQLRGYLKGYLPRLALGKEEFLLYLDKLRPAIIYVEDVLACASDFNLIRKMRMQPYAMEIPVVLFSKTGELLYEEERYQKEGIDLILQNPTRENVLACLKEALS